AIGAERRGIAPGVKRRALHWKQGTGRERVRLGRSAVVGQGGIEDGVDVDRAGAALADDISIDAIEHLAAGGGVADQVIVAIGNPASQIADVIRSRARAPEVSRHDRVVQGDAVKNLEDAATEAWEVDAVGSVAG